jgi:hypothetical protein
MPYTILFQTILNDKTMFDILPDECLLIICGLIFGEKDNTNYPYYFGWDWKKKMTPKQIMEGRLVKWRRPAFTRILPLMVVSKEMNHIFDTNNIWTYLYEQEFRKGVPYKRKPKEARKVLLDRATGIIKKRYEPILVDEKEKVRIGIEQVKQTMKKLHIIDTAFSQIRPQLGSEEYTDDDRKMDRLPIIMSPVIHLPEGYRNSWGAVSPRGWTLESVVNDRIRVARRGEALIRKKKVSKEKILEIEKIMKRL